MKTNTTNISLTVAIWVFVLAGIIMTASYCSRNSEQKQEQEQEQVEIKPIGIYKFTVGNMWGYESTYCNSYEKSHSGNSIIYTMYSDTNKENLIKEILISKGYWVKIESTSLKAKGYDL